MYSYIDPQTLLQVERADCRGDTHNEKLGCLSSQILNEATIRQSSRTVLKALPNATVLQRNFVFTDA